MSLLIFIVMFVVAMCGVAALIQTAQHKRWFGWNNLSSSERRLLSIIIGLAVLGAVALLMYLLGIPLPD